MLGRLKFALDYAIRQMRRDRQRTLFAILSIAAGVATVVALRMLGLMLTDAMTANAQAFLRGDIRVESSSGSSSINLAGANTRSFPFDSRNVDRIAAWAQEHGVEVTYTLSSDVIQAAVRVGDKAGPPAMGLAIFIDPAKYPFYDTIRAEEPSGALLKDLFTGPHQVVLARRMADQMEAKIGDSVRLGSAETPYTVTGIVPDQAESSLDNIAVMLFGFVYVDRAAIADFGLPADAGTRAYLKIPAGVTEDDVASMIRNDWPRPSGDGGQFNNWRMRTATQVLRQNTVVADVISRFVLVLSLVGLVIGGVGIINTMLVAVNRRSSEIAVLKTLGLQGSGVSLVFIVEALLTSVLGSFVGIVFGYLLSFIARDFGQQAFAVPLPWRLYLEPALIGVALGVAITIIFAFLPTLMAGRVRPSLVLRQGNIPMARAGFLPSMLALALLILGIGTLIALIIGGDIGSASRVGNARVAFEVPSPLTVGIVGTAVTFLILGVIVALMWVVVWLLGKLPSFRIPSLRIALRGLTTHRARTALSLLALVIGMTALSGTLIMSRSIQILLYTSISEPMGGNVIIMPLSLTKGLVYNQLDNTEGVNGYRDVRFPTAVDIRAIDGHTSREMRTWFDQEDASSMMRSAQLELVLGMRVHGSPPRGNLVEGRFLDESDAGQPHMVLPYLPELAAAGVRVGSTVTVRQNNRDVDYTVVGLVAPDERTSLIPFSLSDSAVQVPLDMIRTQMPFDFIIADVEQDRVKDALSAVAIVPGAFVFDITLFDSMISRLLQQFAALPLLVATLSLFAATALIATTVSLATMERRRQIAVLKAVGVSRWQALWQLLIENGIVGFTGGILSLLPTVLILLAVPALTQGLVTLPTPMDLILLMLALSIGITLFATILTAWTAATEKPLNVLRAE